MSGPQRLEKLERKLAFWSVEVRRIRQEIGFLVDVWSVAVKEIRKEIGFPVDVWPAEVRKIRKEIGFLVGVSFLKGSA